MNKKKILVLAMTLSMVAILAIGGTIAYFTDTDNATNTFSLGNVDIQIREDFDDEAASKIVPGRDVNKDVFVKNIGSEEAYVRVHIAFPSALDDGDPSLNASKNLLHWNFLTDSYADGYWSWNESKDGANYPGNGSSEWAYYETTIDSKPYSVYVATYETALAAGAETAYEAITKVYLDKNADCTVAADGTVTYTDKNGNTFSLKKDETFDIKVFAEGVQKEGFADAWTALNTGIKKAGTYNPWEPATAVTKNTIQ